MDICFRYGSGRRLFSKSCPLVVHQIYHAQLFGCISIIDNMRRITVKTDVSIYNRFICVSIASDFFPGTVRSGQVIGVHLIGILSTVSEQINRGFMNFYVAAACSHGEISSFLPCF